MVPARLLHGQRLHVLPWDHCRRSTCALHDPPAPRSPEPGAPGTGNTPKRPRGAAPSACLHAVRARPPRSDARNDSGIDATNRAPPVHAPFVDGHAAARPEGRPDAKIVIRARAPGRRPVTSRPGRVHRSRFISPAGSALRISPISRIKTHRHHRARATRIGSSSLPCYPRPRRRYVPATLRSRHELAPRRRAVSRRRSRGARRSDPCRPHVQAEPAPARVAPGPPGRSRQHPGAPVQDRRASAAS